MRIAQRDRDVPQPFFMPYPPDRAARQPRFELTFGPCEELDETGVVEAVPRREFGL